MTSPTRRSSRIPMIPGGADTRFLETAGVVSFRMLTVAAVGYLGYQLFIQVRSVALAMITALLIGSVLQPQASRLRALGVPRTLSAIIVFVGSLLVLTLTGSFVVNQVVDQAPEIQDRATEALADLTDRLSEPPFNIESERLENLDQEITDWIQGSGILNADRAASIGGFATSAFSGLFIALTLLFFICKDGDKFPRYLEVVIGPERGERVNRVGAEIWQTTAAYLRGVGLTGLVDGVLIGIALAILGVPLYVPLGLLTFMGSFIPVVGATLAGILAATVALATNGPGTAIAVVGVVLAVQQLEGNLLAPMLLGRAVRLHPVTILLSLAVGATVAGIWGALLSVPAAAAVRTALTEFVPTLQQLDDEPEPTDGESDGQNHPTDTPDAPRN